MAVIDCLEGDNCFLKLFCCVVPVGVTAVAAVPAAAKNAMSKSDTIVSIWLAARLAIIEPTPKVSRSNFATSSTISW